MLAFLIGAMCGGIIAAVVLGTVLLDVRARIRWLRSRITNLRADNLDNIRRLAVADADLDRLHCTLADRDTELRLLRDILAERDAEIAMTRELAEHPIPLIRRAEPRPL